MTGGLLHGATRIHTPTHFVSVVVVVAAVLRHTHLTHCAHFITFTVLGWIEKSFHQVIMCCLALLKCGQCDDTPFKHTWFDPDDRPKFQRPAVMKLLYVDDFILVATLTPNGYTATWYDDDTLAAGACPTMGPTLGRVLETASGELCWTGQAAGGDLGVVTLSFCAGTSHQPWFGKEADNADVMHVFGLCGFSKSSLPVKPLLVNEVGGLRGRVLAAFVGGETPRGAADPEMVVDKMLATPAAAAASATRPEDDGRLHTLWVEFDEHRSRHKNGSTA